MSRGAKGGKVITYRNLCCLLMAEILPMLRQTQINETKSEQAHIRYMLGLTTQHITNGNDMY